MDNEVSRNFYLPLSVQASEELEAVQLLLQNSDWDPEVWDIWSYNWNSMNFSSKKAYKFLQGTQEASPLFSWIWSAGNQGKHNFFLLAPQGQLEYKKPDLNSVGYEYFFRILSKSINYIHHIF